MDLDEMLVNPLMFYSAIPINACMQGMQIFLYGCPFKSREHRAEISVMVTQPEVGRSQAVSPSRQGLFN